MKVDNMEYNTARPELIIPEYGRNIQKMVDHCVGIEDRDERNRCASVIVEVMGQVNNQFKDADDFKNTLWTHLYIISDFKLDIDCPYEVPEREELKKGPKKMAYPQSKIKYKHYGKTTEALIKKAIEFEDGEEKDALIESIANLMKRSYLNFNRDSVKDEIIFDQLVEISEGQLKIPEGLKLISTSEIIGKPTSNQQNKPKKKNKKRRR